MSITTDILSGKNFFLNQEARDYAEGVEDVSGVKVAVIFGEHYLRRLFVIVETYDHKNFGKGKRRYHAEFSEAERRVISRWYLRIYAWYLRTGIPRAGVRMAPSTYETLCKAADFFATI